MTEKEISVLDLVNEKFDHIKTELCTIKEDVKEIKEVCRDRYQYCMGERKELDARLDNIEAGARADSAADEERDRNLETRLSRRQIVANGVSGILGAVMAFLLMFFKGWI